MIQILRLLLAIYLLLSTTLSASAHPPTYGDAGYLHVASSVNHLIGLIFLGVLSGFYVRFFGGRGYIFCVMAFFVMASIHSHITTDVEVGKFFALGFLGAALILLLSGGDLTLKLLNQLGTRSTRPR